MRKIITTTFVTLDGVMQAPGGPEEDTSNNFSFGGWTANYDDSTGDRVMDGFMSEPFDLLLGRKTYEIFAAYWPKVKDAPVIGERFNKTTKYVVSHQNLKLDWQNSKLITGDIVAALKKLKQEEGDDLWVYGSGNLIHTLLANNLVDRLHLWIFPITLGRGKKLFEDNAHPKSLKLQDSKVTSTGVIIATYEPA